MNDSPLTPRILTERRALFLFIFWVLLVFVGDLATIHWFPVPQNDEVMYVDPAASLLREGRWASSAWYGRENMTFWTGNPPAYSFSLYLWMSIFGFGSLEARSLNCFLLAVTLITGWVAVRRLKLIPAPAIRWTVFAALSLCYPVSYCVRCGRPDVLGMLLLAAGGLAWSAPRIGPATAGLAFCAMCLPLIGLHYAFYMPLVLGVLLWKSSREDRLKMGSLILGGILGSFLLFAYHAWYAGWGGLFANMEAVRSQRSGDPISNIVELLNKLFAVYYFGRPHFLLAFTAIALLALHWKSLPGISRRYLVMAGIFLAVTGILVGIAAYFGAPYQWLAVVPAVLLLASCVAHSWPMLGRISRLACAAVALGFALSGRVIFVGLGALLGTASYEHRIEQAALQITGPADVAYVDWQLYYALRFHVGRTYYLHVLNQLRPDEKSAVNVAFVTAGPDGIRTLDYFFGGEWVHVADLPAPAPLPFPKRFAVFFNAELFYGTPLAAYRRVHSPNNALR